MKNFWKKEKLITLNECSTIAAEAREEAKRAKSHACKNTKRPMLIRTREKKASYQIMGIWTNKEEKFLFIL
jgi:hypothetical protein